MKSYLPPICIMCMGIGIYIPPVLMGGSYFCICERDRTLEKDGTLIDGKRVYFISENNYIKRKT